MPSARLRSNEAYTMIEMVVTFGIIGILAAIAYPNYVNYVSRSRQAEAKTALAAIYNSERNFFGDTGAYTKCLNQIGYNAGTTPNRFYMSGFWPNGIGAVCGTSGPVTCGVFLASLGSNQCCNYYQVDNGVFTGSTCSVTSLCNDDSCYTPTQTANSSFSLSYTATSMTYITQFTFTATAAGNISATNTSTDMWQIDQTKNVVQQSSGI